MDLYKVGKIEAIALVVIVMLNHLVLNLPKIFFNTAGCAAWINAIFVFAIALIFLFIILKLFKNFNGMDILDVSYFVGGNTLKNIIGFLFIAFFMLIASALLRDFSRSLNIIYFRNIPIYLVIIVFLLVALLANRIGSNVIIKTTTIITTIVLINLGVTFFLTAPQFEFNNIFPILGKGAKEIFLSGSTNIFAFSGFCVLYFIMPMLKSSKEFNKIAIWSIVISGIYLVFCILSLLLSFSYVVDAYDLSPMYLIIRTTQFGKFLQRPESLFMFFWILSLMSYVSICIMFSCNIFQKITNTRKSQALAYFFTSLLYFGALIPRNISQFKFIEDVIYKYFSIILIFFISMGILILANLKYHRKNMKLEGRKLNEK